MATSTKLHVYPQEVSVQSGQVTVSAVIEGSGQNKETLWYRVAQEHAASFGTDVDYLAVANIFKAMAAGSDMVIHGTVSTRLLDNLTEFQQVWSSWYPNRYKQVEVTADKEYSGSEPIGAAIAAFTGGIDSSYTVMRHSKKQCGRLTQPIKACLFVHGFDIPLADADAFERAAARVRHTLFGVGLEAITMASNHKELNPQWDDTHGSGIASSLMLLSGRFDRALIGSTYTYSEIGLKWGSNPLSDRLFSSEKMSVVHDGAETGRGSKMVAIRQWPEAYEDLRVCWSAPNKDENCGKCGKCALTLLGCKLKKIPIPKSFNGDLPDHEIEQLVFDEVHLEVAETLLKFATREDASASWVVALRKCVNSCRKLHKSGGVVSDRSVFARVKNKLKRMSGPQS